MSTPAVFPALALIAGVALGVLAPGVRPSAAAVLVLLLALAALSWRAGRDRVFTPLVLGGFVSVGSVLGAMDADRALRTPLRAFFDDYGALPGGGVWPLTVEGRLRSDALPAEYGASLTIDVERVRTPCGWIPAAGGARLAVSGELAARALDNWSGGRRVRAPAHLRLPTSYRNPGAPDEQFSLARRGIALVGSIKSAALVEIVSAGSPPEEAAAATRAYTRRTLRAAMPERPVAAAIVTAILIGDRGGLEPALQRRLQEAGTYHVIAISGGNIAILAGLAFLVLRALRVPPRVGSLALALLLCAYGYVAGGGASVARATVAAAIYLLASAADHRSRAMNVLATVALIAVVYEPLEVFDPGLWLSYGATLAILIGAGRVLRGRISRKARPDGALFSTASASRRLRRATGAAVAGLAAVLAGTVCAELALFPVGASVFQRVTVAGLLLNFAAIPLMTVAQVAGLAVLGLAPISTLLARAAGIVAALGATGLTESARLLDAAPWLSWRVAAPAVALIALYYASLAGWLAVPVWPRVRRAMLVTAAGAALLIASPWPAGVRLPMLGDAGGRDLRVTFLDVGQGDAVLLQWPGGGSLLLDAAGVPGSGFDLGERVIGPALLALGVRRLDYLAITHGDPDHVLGAAAIARDFRPRELWEGVPVPPHATLRELCGITARGGGARRLVRPDDRLEAGGVTLRVLHPPEPDWERQRVRNDDSIVLEARYGDVSLVLPGDIGDSVEASLVTKLAHAPLRILKAAHHGSATSSSEAWLSAVRPAAVIFSCGHGNRYGHPHPSVLSRVAALGAQVFRTDQDGAVTVRTDGSTVEITTYTGRRTRLRAEWKPIAN
ncbi:MAG TPA: DNA internalization-related competence protein ComEC/Rec2 [Vicinamibacterales bacterium]|nr:DNA internalization-related competence protein ComEC/Rec2 [Vicinamibacterales bacterium]